MNFSLSHLLISTGVTLVVSHFGSNYLASITPKGYGFWFMTLSTIISLCFIGY